MLQKLELSSESYEPVGLKEALTNFWKTFEHNDSYRVHSKPEKLTTIFFVVCGFYSLTTMFKTFSGI